ncbi:type II/IV secretion system protein, partial [Pseudomonas frederiksbergensis]|nr:type II/IV secretion system protein [Pseudomonas frederiksbergensis]
VQIRQLSQTFFQVAQSVSGASQQQSVPIAAGNLEQLLEVGSRANEVQANDAHIVSIVDWLLQYAFEQRASDIHLE